MRINVNVSKKASETLAAFNIPERRLEVDDDINARLEKIGMKRSFKECFKEAFNVTD